MRYDGRMLLTTVSEGDVDRGRPPDVAFHAPQRWSPDRRRELRPEFCLRGHRAPRFMLGWSPGWGRRYECTVRGCDSVQYRYH